MHLHSSAESLHRLLELVGNEGLAVVVVIVILATLLTGLDRLADRWLSGFRRPAPATAGAIDSPTRTYHLLSEQAGGDVCDVTLATSGGTTYVLKVPRHAGASDLVVKERDVLTALANHGCPANYRRYLPELSESFRWGLRRVNSFAYREGLYTAEEIRLSHPQGVDGRHLGWMFNRTLEVLGYVHQRGWLHGAVLPPHLLFDTANHGLVLVDWIHAQQIAEPLAMVPERFKPWYPPECFRREGATEATDIYLAARSMIFLAGGDPLAAALPPHIPEEMAEFFRQCLHVLPRARPQDAWRLRDHFAELLERLYGPPQFHVLAMH
jgi:hypothetical protein